MLNYEDKTLVLDERASKRFFKERHRVYLCAAITSLFVVIVIVVAVIAAADAQKGPDVSPDDDHTMGTSFIEVLSNLTYRMLSEHLTVMNCYTKIWCEQ